MFEIVFVKFVIFMGRKEVFIFFKERFILLEDYFKEMECIVNVMFLDLVWIKYLGDEVW